MQRSQLCVQWLNFQFLLLVLWQSNVKSEIFSSVFRVQEAVRMQQNAIRELQVFVRGGFSDPGLIDFHKYLYESLDLIQQNLLNPKSTEEVAENPIRTFQLIKYRTFVLPAIQITLESIEQNPNELTPDLKVLLQRIRWRFNTSTEEDFEGTAFSLLRLQAVYNLPLQEFVQGNIFGVPTGAKLSADDVYTLGNVAYGKGHFGSALKWLEQAWNMCLGKDENGRIAVKTLLVSFGLYKEVQSAFDDHILSPKTKKFISEDIHPSEKRGPVPAFEKAYIFDTDSYGFMPVDVTRKYMNLCQEAAVPDTSWKANPFTNLTCRVWNRDQDSYLLLMPIRVEFLHSTEPIYLIHDAIRERTIQNIRRRAEPNMARAEIQQQDGSSVPSEVRTSQYYFYSGQMENDILPFFHRMEHATKLNLKAWNDPSGGSEFLQTSNCGIAGHYVLHTDCDHKTDLRHRMATVLFYLSDVKLGGATVFPLT
ncbi:unnamed protein product, partial [Cyprideis torosa]